MNDSTPPDILGYPSATVDEIRADLAVTEQRAMRLWIEVNGGRVTPEIAVELESAQRRIESDYELLEMMGALALPRVVGANR